MKTKQIEAYNYRYSKSACPMNTIDLRSYKPASPPSNPQRRFGRRNVLMVAAGMIVILGSVITAYSLFNQPIKIPSEVRERVLFPIYLPSSLPQDFTIDKDSYDTRQNVLIFSAVSEHGDRLTFSEQPKPTDFDINAFHQRSLKNAKSLSGTPFTSVLGDTENGGKLLSVQAEGTWILVSSKSAQATEDLTLVAKKLQKS